MCGIKLKSSCVFLSGRNPSCYLEDILSVVSLFMPPFHICFFSENGFRGIVAWKSRMLIPNKKKKKKGYAISTVPSLNSTRVDLEIRHGTWMKDVGQIHTERLCPSSPPLHQMPLSHFVLVTKTGSLLPALLFLPVLSVCYPPSQTLCKHSVSQPWTN